MRKVTVIFGLGVLLLGGCNLLPWMRDNGNTIGPEIRNPNPTAQELVHYLNDNAARVQTVESRTVALECSQGTETVGLEGHLVCQPKQRNFRMDAKALGSTEVDLGSNREEFWFWIKRAPEPYLYHCRHEDFASGRARMPFPFQPDWIVEALGIADYDPTRHYVVEAGGENIDLVENAVSPQGAPVRKVTRFTRRQNHVQVSAHLLEDANRQIICSAYIRELQQDRTTGAVLPRQVLLSWPAQQIRMKMTLEGLGVNQQMAPQRVALLFSRPNMGGVQSFDLARGPDVSTGGLRQTNGYDR